MPEKKEKMQVGCGRVVPTGVRCSVTGCHEQAVEEVFDDLGMPRGALCREHLRELLRRAASKYLGGLNE